MSVSRRSMLAHGLFGAAPIEVAAEKSQSIQELDNLLAQVAALTKEAAALRKAQPLIGSMVAFAGL